jgi:hypothetical protein
MARQKTGNEVGRPKTYLSEDEKPVTVSLRIPRPVYEQAQKYVSLHRTTMTEVLLDGLRLRLETPADPRDIILSDDNTVMQELQDMIRTAVQAEIGKLNTFMGSAFDALKPAPAPEASGAPMPALPHDGNTVLQEMGEAEQLHSPTPAAPADSKDGQTAIPPYDETKYKLGELCPQKHDWGNTGQSLRRLVYRDCLLCKRERDRNRIKAKRQPRRV